jgi:DNA-directed RNA polymerase subunit RPC12/RpoP
MFYDHIFSMRDLEIFLTGLGVMMVIFILMRLFKVMKKGACPSCTGKLVRKARTMPDKIVKLSTFGILPFRRYKCVHCGWEGLRWNTRVEQKKEPRP